MASYLHLITLILIWNCCESVIINLRERCEGLDELNGYAICTFSEEGTYANLGESSSVERIKFDSLRNSKITVENIPNVRVIEISSVLLDVLEPCEHIIFDSRLGSSVSLILEGTKHYCVSTIY